MVEHNAQSLQRLYMVQAIDLFHEAYAPYVLDTMRAHFGDRLLAHMRSLVKRNKSPIFVDVVDNQPRPDFLALIHVMTRDGGLRDSHAAYAPVLFAPHGSHNADGMPVAVPSFKELRLIRLRRNALNHQGILTGDIIIDSIERIIRMVDILPSSYQSTERRMRLQLLLARVQSSEFELHLQQMRHAQQADAHEQMHQALIDAHVVQLQRVEQQVQAQYSDVQQAHAAVHEVQTKLNQLLVDQQSLVRGTAESVVDVRHQTESQIARIQQALAQLQLPQPVDIQTAHTIERLQRELAAQQQITADMRIELNRLHEQIDTSRSAPLSPPSRTPWAWVVVLVVAVSLGWLWYSGWLMWGIVQIQPYLERVWPLQKN
jgi:hypothetical protein